MCNFVPYKKSGRKKYFTIILLKINVQYSYPGQSQLATPRHGYGHYCVCYSSVRPLPVGRLGLFQTQRIRFWKFRRWTSWIRIYVFELVWFYGFKIDGPWMLYNEKNCITTWPSSDTHTILNFRPQNMLAMYMYYCNIRELSLTTQFKNSKYPNRLETNETWTV